MRHINQMTREELTAKLVELDNEAVRVVNSDPILYKQIRALTRTLDAEATLRANSIPVGATAAAYGVVL